MKLAWLVAVVAGGLLGLAANAAPGPWEQPAANLAEQVAEILGPGQARLTIRNLSTIPTDEIPAIRRLLEQDLKAHGVVASGAESANTIRVTLSESLRERLWVAEVVQGNETRVAMVRVEAGAAQRAQAASGLTLRKQTVLTTGDAVLAMLETPHGLVAVEPEEIVLYGQAAGGWQEQKRVGIGQKQPLPRDPRGAIVPLPDGEGFAAFLAGMACAGSYQATGEWTVRCREGDDPWTIAGPPLTQKGTTTAQSSIPTQVDIGVISLKAFYDAARNYFTGVVTPSFGVELPPFYSAAQIVRSASSAPLLIGGIDGKVLMAENGGLKPVAGTRDWGSDFAAIRTGCGAGMQILASSSGAAAADSLRAYELPAQEAIPASDPLAMGGTVTALWTAPDGKSAMAVVRSATDQYEVDRVTAICN